MIELMRVLRLAGLMVLAFHVAGLMPGLALSLAHAQINDTVSVEARARDNPQSNPADIEGGFTKAPDGFQDEIRVTNDGVKGKGAGVYNDPVNDGATLTIVQESGPVVVSVDGREGVGAIYWVEVGPDSAGKGRGGKRPDLVADVSDLEVTLTLRDTIGGNEKVDKTNTDSDTQLLVCSSVDGKGSVEFWLNVRDGEFPWRISGSGLVVQEPPLGAINSWRVAKSNLAPGMHRLVATNGTITRRIDFFVFAATIDGEKIDQDNPENVRWEPVTPVVYGGSEPSTADNVRLVAVPGLLPPETEIAKYEWSGKAPFVPPAPSASADTWTIGDIPIEPGNYTFTCVVTLNDGATAKASRDIEVGVRTDDYIVIGWINRAGVPVPAGGAPITATHFPPNGPPVPSPFRTSVAIRELNWGSLAPLGPALTAGDRGHILNWLFRYADNPSPLAQIPGRDFRNLSNEHIDYDEVFAFMTVKTQFKLFNHFQIRYRLNFATGRFNGIPHVLRQQTVIGDTNNPVGRVPLRDPITGIVVHVGPTVFEGQNGSASGPPAISPAPGDDRMSLINDGSPDQVGIRAFNTLTSVGVPSPIFWENITSMIRFRCTSGAAAEVVTQPYPTYEIFRNGRHVATRPQAPSPLGNFTTHPYPFGTVRCSRDEMINVQPGGRCGVATTPPDVTARRIPAVNP